MNIFFKPAAGAFDFLHSGAAMTILLSYIAAYALRIYIMNYFKNTREKGVPQDNKGFFTWEQIAAAITMFLATLLVFFAPDWFGWNPPQVQVFREAILVPKPKWE